MERFWLASPKSTKAKACQLQEKGKTNQNLGLQFADRWGGSSKAVCCGQDPGFIDERPREALSAQETSQHVPMAQIKK